MQDATFSIAIVRDIVQYVAMQGGEVDRLYRSAHIDPACLDNPDQQVSGEVLKSLWREAVLLTGDRDLGLHIGEAFDLSAIGIVGYVLLNCKTYRQVLEKLSQYTRLFSQGVAIHHTVSEGWVQCDCEIVAGLKNYLIDEPRHPIESTFAALMAATQQLTGNPLRAEAVWFQHLCPGATTEHQRIFQTQAQFSQPTNRIIFNADCLDWAVRSANANLLSVFEQHATQMLNAQGLNSQSLNIQTPNTQSQTPYLQKVVSAITQQIQGEVPTLEAIARTLTLSMRQLQRELQAENTSYQQLLDETRHDLALRHLQNQDTSIHDVAFLLGFSEPSAFYRAFKRWTGQTPRHYRSAKLKPKSPI
ncbi:MAG TPA: AraC family transcriptional regulator [Coleofasciculaceae cyanobacterium]|jgi:AraC-like DNA-binding protein